MNILINTVLVAFVIAQGYNLPRAYQHQGTLHSAHYNIAANPDPFGNGNKEFPWDRPGGLLRQGHSVKFITLPPGKPIVYYFQGSLTRWAFPKGTVFSEQLYLPEGQLFQIRTRTKVDDGWAFSVFQPFNSLSELNKRLKWLSIPTVTATIKKHTIRSFTSQVEVLPDIPHLSKVLNLPTAGWQDTFGSVWSPVGGIHPKDSILFILNSTNCMNCHKNTALSVRTLSPKGREWYGHIRGDDGIFSWYPFTLDSISHNGASRKLVFNDRWPLEKYDATHHKGYIQTGGKK